MMLFSQFITQHMCICLESILSRIFDRILTAEHCSWDVKDLKHHNAVTGTPAAAFATRKQWHS